MLGLIINPYFPHNLYLFYEHARVKITAGGFATKVGQEWYPYDTCGIRRQLLCGCWRRCWSATSLLTSAIASGRNGRCIFLILSTALLLMIARWKRFAEYFPPFAILFAAFTLENFWRGRAVFTHLPEDVLEDLQPFFDRQETAAGEEEKKQQENWQLHQGRCRHCRAGSGAVR